MAKNYLNNKDLLFEICKSKDEGKLTKTAITMLMLLSARAIERLRYRDEEDKKDCLAFARLDLFKYWDRFNPEKSSNAFAYFTQIAKKGYAKGWNKLHPQKYSGTVSIDGGDDGSQIYSI